MKHIIFYSGGLGSWATTKRVIERHGIENVVLLYTDTRSEDKDLYRFLIRTTFEMFGHYDQQLVDLVEKLPDMPLTDQALAEKRDLLQQIQDRNNEICPGFVWIADGRDIWQVYEDEQLIPNNRWAKCTVNLKKKTAKRWIKANATPEDSILYLGMDWSEVHRTTSAINNWAPYKVEFPLCEEPYISKEEIRDHLESLGIDLPRLYKMGFAHNNCMGFCCRAGQGHFAQLYKERPEFYEFCSTQEKKLQAQNEVNVTILKKVRNGKKYPFSLDDLKMQVIEDEKQLDMFDIGGCGCFID